LRLKLQNIAGKIVQYHKPQCHPLTAMTLIRFDLMGFFLHFLLEGPSGYGSPPSVGCNQLPFPVATSVCEKASHQESQSE